MSEQEEGALSDKGGRMRTVTAAVSRDPDKPLSIEQLQIGSPRRDEVMVEIAAVGICHTDIASHMGLLGSNKPIVLGHEGAGVVVEVGDDVEDLRPGDQVLLTASRCGQCRSCLAGDVAYCESVYALNALGNRPDGSSAFADGDVHSHF